MKMKKMILSVLLLLFLIAGDIYSQTTIKSQFLSINNAYEFTLPQFDVCLPMPAKAGFRVPLFSGKNIKLEVDDITRYYFDLSYLKEPNNFSFAFQVSASENNQLLYMNILELDKMAMESSIQKLVSKDRIKNIPGFKTKLGKTLSYEWEIKEGRMVETHIITFEKYSFSFTLDKDLDKKIKKHYLNMIRKFREKNQSYLKVKYETQAKNGEFEPKEKKVIINPENNKGTLGSSVFFEWPDLGYGLSIPADWEYQIEGKISSQEYSHVKLSFDKSFMDSDYMALSWFRNNEVNVTLRSYRKINPLEMINQMAQMTKHSQSVAIVVDNVPLKAYFTERKNMVH